MNETSLENVFARIDETFDIHLETIRTYLRQPSVSGTGEGVAACADMTASLIESAGGTAEVVPTGGHPAVLGRIEGDGPTLLRYGMFDVQPADEPDWVTPPFSADIRDHPGIGPCVFARGAANSKACLAAFLLSAGVVREVTDLPTSVVLMLDGEEELGSPHLRGVVDDHRDFLKADAAFDLDLGALANGTTSVYLGVKGILSWKLTCRGGDWGGPVDAAHHSSSGVVLASPAWSLVRALSTLVDSDERPLVSGLDARIPPEDEPLLAALIDAWDFATEMAGAGGARAFKTDDPETAVKAMLYSPALNINGLSAGYADGGKTIIPHVAEAVLDLRVPYGCDMDAIDREVRERIASVAPEVEVVEDERCLPAKTRSDSAVAHALIRSHADAGRPPEVWPTAPWWAPYYLFEQVLGLPFATGGAGYSAGAHAANEHASVAGIKEHMKQCAAFLFRFAESHGRDR